MRICYLAHSSSTHTQRWIQYMVERGHEVTVLSLAGPPLACARFVHVRSRLGKAAGLPMLVRQVRREIAQARPEILHAHYSRSNGLLGSLTGFHPFVLSVWGTDIYAVPRGSVWWRTATRFICSRADYICATSRNLAAETRRYSVGKEIAITPFGVDCERFRPLPEPRRNGPFVFGTVKSLAERYGIDILIRAFAEVRSAWEWPGEPRLLIAGRGPAEDELRRLAGDLGVAEAVEFAGFVPHREVPSLMGQMDVFVSVSVVNESFGVSALEASACGLPVIASRAPGFLETVQDGVTGILVPPRDVATTARMMLQLAGDSGLRQRFGSAGRQFVQRNFEWRRNAALMEDIYQRVMHRCAC